MKIKAIESLLKGSKQIIVYRSDRYGQWLGDGSAMYPIHNLPNITEKHLYAMFDIPESKQSKYFFQERGIPKTVDLRDCVEGEQLIQRGKISIIAVGRELEPIHTSVGTVFINTKYLKPFSDEADGYELYERKDADGKTYIVAKSGMLIIGIILPFNVAGPAFLKELELITEGVRLSLKSEKAKTEQISMTD